MNRAEARALHLSRIARQHYAIPHTRVRDECGECAFYVGGLTLALSRQWAPKRDVRRAFAVTPEAIRTPVREVDYPHRGFFR